MKQSVKLIAGNWKMNGLSADLAEAKVLRAALDVEPTPHRVALCPAATLIAQMAWSLKDGSVEIGGQDCHAAASGAFTGSVSAAMLADAGAGLVILGHSERRAGFGETDADVAAAMVERLGQGGATAPILYGGSVKPSNAAEILAVAEVGGALVGGASLKAADFLGIIRAA